MHHNEMVRVYVAVCQMRERGDDPLRSPIMGKAKKLALRVEPLRSSLAAFSVREMDKDNMAPYFVSQELLSTMRTMIRTAHGSRLPHIPQPIQPDGIPEFYRESFGAAP